MRPGNHFVSGIAVFLLLSPPLGVLAQEQTRTAESTQAQRDYTLQTETFVDRIRREGNYRELSLRDAIRLALSNNLDLAIENFNEEINRTNILSTKGFFDPQVSFTVGIDSSESPTTNTLTAGGDIAVFSRDGFTWNSSFSQNLPYGGDIRLALNNSRTSNNSTFNTFNPSYNTGFNVTFRQPLWRGFIDTSTERQLKIQNLDSQISDLNFEQRVSEIVRNVQDRYWDLVEAIESYEAQRESLNLAVIRYQDSQKRVEIGIEAPIEITSARSEAATREQTLIQSEVGISDADNDLKELLAPDPHAPIWDVRVIPVDRPVVEDIQISLQDAIRIAQERRPELKTYQREFTKIEVNRKFFKREGKPQVDLQISYGSTGIAGTAFLTEREDVDGDGIDDITRLIPDPNNPFNGNLFDSIQEALGFNFTNYNISANVTIPLRNRTNAANIAQQNIQERRLMQQRRQTQQRIAVEVRKAHTQIQIQKKRLEAARVARELAEERMDGENKRFQAGIATNFEVLNVQRDLANSVQDELAAQIAYVKSVTSLRQAMYTLIESSDIVFAKGSETQ